MLYFMVLTKISTGKGVHLLHWPDHLLVCGHPPRTDCCHVSISFFRSLSFWDMGLHVALLHSVYTRLLVLTGCQEIDVPLLTKPYKFIIKTKKTMSLANVTSLNFDTFLNALGHTTNQVVKNIGRDVCPSRFHIFYQSFLVRRVR